MELTKDILSIISFSLLIVLELIVTIRMYSNLKEYKSNKKMAEELVNAILENDKQPKNVIDYESMKSSDLRNMAREKKVKNYCNMKKSELIDALKNCEK